MIRYESPEVTLHHGDCLDVLRTLPDCSVDAVVTDPPYGLEFMGKGWDAPWRETDVNADAGFNGGGIRQTATLPSFTGSTNPKCLRCKGTRRGRRDGTAKVAVCLCADGGHFPNVRAVEMRAFAEWCETWVIECLRVLKPGGHLLAFGGTRTWHRLACAVEDAGFEIRDSIAWMYGSGFPKSLDVSKAIDKTRTEDRAPVDAVRSWLNERRIAAGYSHDAINKHFGHASNGGGSSSAWMTNPTSKSLPTWEQWQELKRLFEFSNEMDAEAWRLNGRKGKPGDNFEAREVLSETVREVKGGSWADNLATGRYSLGEKVIRDTAPATPEAEQWQGWGTALKPAFEPVVVARKPLVGTVAGNVLAWGTGALNVDGCRVETGDTLGRAKGGWLKGDYVGGESPQWDSRGKTVEGGRWPANVVLDEDQAAALDEQSGEGQSRVGKPRAADSGEGWGMTATGAEYDDLGGASRFFYVAKADASERPKVGGVMHPTVKPLSLMRWLVRLVTPPGGTVLEPFAGSGTTVEACLLEGFRCVAIEKGDEYLPLIEARIYRRRDPVAAHKLAGDDEDNLFDLLDDEQGANT